MTEQINSLKRGSEIIVCTPGRMIDILCLNQGRLVGLRRVSYVVLDEADRMLDMGFEPQITTILQNARPDRQLVMFSATFPTHVENLARKMLKKPVMIVVGGRTEVAAEVSQTIEVRTKEQKFPRLLQILGEWYDRGLILVFVDKQQKADYVVLWREGLTRSCSAISCGRDTIPTFCTEAWTSRTAIKRSWISRTRSARSS